MLLTSTILFISHVLSAGCPSSSPALGEGKPSIANHVLVAPAIAGRVITELGEPLPGVFVAVQGTPQATSTNAAGNFLLAVNAQKPVLLFKCQGYRDQTVTVTANNALTIKMYAVTRSTSSNTAAILAEAAANPPAEPEAANAPTVLSYSEVAPTFPGGDAAFRKFVGDNAHYPEGALAKGLSGTVYVSFVVDEQGRITDAAVAKGCGHGFDEEAVRLIRLMPWWNPGQMAGKAVRVSRIMPVPFVYRERQ
jgi:TonB family protein